MTAPIGPAVGVPPPKHRAMYIVVACALLALVALSAPLHQRVAAVLIDAQPAIALHPVLAPVLFVVLAALSAMLMFFSSLMLVPIGVVAWGAFPSFLMLWAGWFLGGTITYSIGRFLGRPIVQRLLTEQQIAQYERRIPAGGSFATAFLIQISVPTDIAGYFFGLVRYRPGPFFAALALAELPYAFGTVFLGAAFVERQYLVLVVVALAAGSVAAWQWYKRRRVA